MSVKIEGKEYLYKTEVLDLIENETGFRPSVSTLTVYMKKNKLPRASQFKIAGRVLFEMEKVKKGIHENLIVRQY